MVHGVEGGGDAAVTHDMHEEPHASNRTYIAIALVLGVLTALEVMIFYVEALAPVLVPILLVLSGAKFALVVLALSAFEQVKTAEFNFTMKLLLLKGFCQA